MGFAKEALRGVLLLSAAIALAWSLSIVLHIPILPVALPTLQAPIDYALYLAVAVLSGVLVGWLISTWPRPW